MMLVQSGDGEGVAALVDYFMKHRRSILATDEENGITLRYSHGNSKYGLTKYTLKKWVDLYHYQTHEFKAWGDKDALEYARNYIQIAKWRGKIKKMWDTNLPE